jgi:hypothetical protein
VVTAGVSWRTRRGGPPALAETAAGLLYAPGTATLGVDAVLRRYARQWAASAVPVVVNLRADAPEEFALAAAELERTGGVVALELDLVPAGGDGAPPLGHDPGVVRRILVDVRRVCGLPVLVKLPADAPDPAAVLRGAAGGGAAGATLSGPRVVRRILVDVRRRGRRRGDPIGRPAGARREARRAGHLPARARPGGPPRPGSSPAPPGGRGRFRGGPGGGLPPGRGGRRPGGLGPPGEPAGRCGRTGGPQGSRRSPSRGCITSPVTGLGKK